MKKKIVGILVGLCVVFSVTACGEADTKEETGKEESGKEEKITEVTPLYKNLDVEIEPMSDVTDEDVELSVQNALESNKEQKEITDRAVQDGDVVDIDYIGKVDDVAFDGGADVGYELRIGSGTFVPGFEEGLVGAKKGETVDVKLTFPEDYAEDLAGKEAVFEVKVNKVLEETVPKLTDEFVQKISETSKTVEEFRIEIRKSLEELNKSAYESQKQQLVWSKVMESVKLDEYPQDEVDILLEKVMESFEAQASQYNMKLEDYVAANGMSMEDFNEFAKENAKQIYLANQVVVYIADAEKIKITEKEYDEKIQEVADSYGYENVEALYKVASREDLEMDILTQEIVTWLVENTTFTEIIDKEPTDEKSEDK